jgi:hypothetical protein
MFVLSGAFGVVSDLFFFGSNVFFSPNVQTITRLSFSELEVSVSHV